MLVNLQPLADKKRLVLHEFDSMSAGVNAGLIHIIQHALEPFTVHAPHHVVVIFRRQTGTIHIGGAAPILHDIGKG